MPAIEVVEEKFKCSGVFPNAWNVFKCYGMPTSGMRCPQVLWDAHKCYGMPTSAMGCPQVVWDAFK